MAEIEVTLAADPIGRDIACYTVGFTRLSIEGSKEEGSGAGSGTLVYVGNVYGILTAAHVIRSLPKEGQVGIVCFQDFAKYKNLRFQIEHADPILICGDDFTQGSLDIAFLRLPEPCIAALRATNSFYNLNKCRIELLAEQELPGNAAYTAVGLIEEMTEQPSPNAVEPFRKITFSAFCSNGIIANLDQESEYDIQKFLPTKYEDFALPSNFGGASGGAVWRLLINTSGAAPAIEKRYPFGVLFYQEADHATLRFQGPLEIYDRLYNAISAKWPADAAANGGQ